MTKIKTITNESVVLPKRSLNAESAAASEQPAKLVVENGPGLGDNEFPAEGFGDGEDDIFGGDVSSIMIKPD